MIDVYFNLYKCIIFKLYLNFQVIYYNYDQIVIYTFKGLIY